MSISIAENLRSARERIAVAAELAGRDPSGIELLAVTKTKPAEMVLEAVKAGQRLFGENRFQDAVDKVDQVRRLLGEEDPPIRWDFIGHIQSNKVRKILEYFALLHGIDRRKIVDRVDRIAGELGITARGLIQVNVSGAASQFGVAPQEVEQLAEYAAGREHLRIEGLMAIGPLTDDQYLLRRAFERVRIEAERIGDMKMDGVSMQTLSMGMSADFEAAIAEGATMVRLGTVIFGERG